MESPPGGGAPRTPRSDGRTARLAQSARLLRLFVAEKRAGGRAGGRKDSIYKGEIMTSMVRMLFLMGVCCLAGGAPPPPDPPGGRTGGRSVSKFTRIILRSKGKFHL